MSSFIVVGFQLENVSIRCCFIHSSTLCCHAELWQR